jgi:hypothetical protein
LYENYQFETPKKFNDYKKISEINILHIQTNTNQTNTNQTNTNQTNTNQTKNNEMTVDLNAKLCD